MALFQFRGVWNDYLVALIIRGPNPNTLGDRGQDWHLLNSAAFMGMIGPLIVFFGPQRCLVRDLLAGSGKGWRRDDIP